MKLDAALPPVHLKDVTAIAKAAEDIGFDALWTQETQHDPFLPCTLIAEHTARLNFGTAIAVSFARSSANLAYTSWDLAAQSGGRFILGLGTQVKAHIERRFGQPWPESVTGKLREQIEVIRAFWDCWQNGTKLNYRGEYYKATLMSPFFNPGPLPSPLGEKSIPVYIAGVNTGLAKLAGELCDGFHAHPFQSIRYLKEVILPAIEEAVFIMVKAYDALGMDELRDAPTRPLDDFEREHLPKLQAGEPLAASQGPRRIRVLGAIRAHDACRACHAANADALIGAFSYDLRLDRAPSR
jgi:alkanesulfonate monooxygenase SsuD/methylene tetrahydromethanopterin reductase-like flavin-dependent oxidoreductase (luciferase family)